MSDINQFDVPFQIQQLISLLKDRRENSHIRGNYRMRLDAIRNAIGEAIDDYDVEMGRIPTTKKKIDR